MLFADVFFCLVYAAFIPAHAVIGLSASSMLTATPVVATFALAASGINSLIISVFVVTSAVAAPYVAYAWETEHVVACVWVVWVALVTERRVALLAIDRPYPTLGYKALTAHSQDASRMSVADPMNSRFTSETLPLSRGGNGSDLEDGYYPPGKDSSALGLVDQFMTRFGGNVGGGGLFATGGSSSGATASGKSAAVRSRISPEQVLLPGAAGHEAPLFSDADKVDTATEAAETEFRSEYSAGTLASSMQQKGGPGASAQSLDPGSPTNSSGIYLRGVVLSGFKNSGINKLFVERPAAKFKVNGRESYWAASNEYFLYKSINTGTWGVGKAKRFEQIKAGKSNGLAHSPEGFEIWVEGNDPAGIATKSWREWDIEGNKWASRAGAGVQSRGKVKPKNNATDSSNQPPLGSTASASADETPKNKPLMVQIGVQTDAKEVKSKEAQTDLTQKPDRPGASSSAAKTTSAAGSSTAGSSKRGVSPILSSLGAAAGAATRSKSPVESRLPPPTGTTGSLASSSPLPPPSGTIGSLASTTPLPKESTK
eukprot:TRINITY_DN82880_c0_g1_i1.p1 TRINITY_DN82880_c0_g1~~TRINITY_DN82880_c0_g1_i1.p1  ORF type:complete len:542 (-),score=95.85 TRINITY_DN82880_c0_g1_i1:172-1797(-)